MPDDYAKTADRMMQDARALHQAGAYRNACYLAGYVIECTLKVLLEKAGMSPDQIHDLESLHDQVSQLLVSNNAVVAKYGDPASLAPTLLHQVQPPGKGRRRGTIQYFCHWDPRHRYDGSRWDGEQTSKDYLREADKSYDVIVQMIVDGVL